MTKMQLITYGIILVTKLMGRLRSLSEQEGDGPEVVEQARTQIQTDIQEFTQALSGNRRFLDHWLINNPPR